MNENDHRLFSVRVNVHSKSVLGVDATIGNLEVPLSFLKEERTREGWFPLQVARTTVLEAATAGSIKLRLKWVHSVEGLRKHLMESLDM